MEERKNEKNGRMDEFTWQQVAKHNSNESCWVINKGLVYDVTCFIDSHPGGRHLLLLCAGRDITDLFIPYHWNTSTPSLVLKKYLIGKVINHEFPSFKPDSGFYSTLSKRVHQHFVETNQDPKDMRASVSRLIPMIALAMVCYHLQFFTDLYLPGKYLFAILYGVLQALPLLHSMHDACHSAISHSPNIWYSISHFTMDVFAGASINSWMHQHFLSHHVYTNVSELDSDLPISLQGDFRRIYQDQKWNWIYKYQYIYLPIVYSFLTIKFRLEDLSCTLMMKPNGVIRVAPIKPFNLFVKALFIYWRIILPMSFNRLSTILVLFLISELTTGTYLAWNFQVSHISTETEFSKKRDLNEWAKTQITSTVDYSHGDVIATFMSGALNYQTVHHLFPAISQYYYPELSGIVQEVCLEYGLTYNVLPSFIDAFKEHIRYLFKMGEMGVKVD